jgi:Tfp pilus assembly protein PilF
VTDPADNMPPVTKFRAADAWIACGLLVAVIAIYAQTRGFDFIVYDDAAYIDRADVKGGLTAGGIASVFSDLSSPPYYTPVTHLSHMIDYALWGRQPGRHHLDSVALHALNALLLYFLLRRWDRNDRLWPAAVAAALFALHPLRVESVAWMAERKDLVSGLFFLLMLHAYTSYARRSSGRAGWYSLVAALLAIGLLAKPMLVSAPAVLLLLDYWPLRRENVRWRRLIAEKLPLGALVIASAALTVVGQRNAGAMQSLEQVPLTFRIANAIVSYARYLLMTIWPFNLAAFYPAPRAWGAMIVIASVAVLIAITAWTIIHRSRRPYLVVGWFWFIGMLLPVIGVMQVGEQALADRFTYLPHIGLFIAVTWWAGEAVPAQRQRLAAAMAVVIVGFFAVRSADQAQHWRDTAEVFQHALLVTRDNYVALNQLANIHARRRELEQAEAMYRDAIRIKPEYGTAHANLGSLLVRRREFTEAVHQFEEAIRLRSDLPRAQLGLALALSGLREYERADRAFAEALRLSPRMAEAELSWGLSYKERGDTEHAAQHLHAALAINPQLQLARRALAAIDANPAASAPAPSTQSRPAPASQ